MGQSTKHCGQAHEGEIVSLVAAIPAAMWWGVVSESRMDKIMRVAKPELPKRAQRPPKKHRGIFVKYLHEWSLWAAQKPRPMNELMDWFEPRTGGKRPDQSTVSGYLQRLGIPYESHQRHRPDAKLMSADIAIVYQMWLDGATAHDLVPFVYERWGHRMSAKQIQGRINTYKRRHGQKSDHRKRDES